MSTIMQDITDPQLPAAIDANFAEELACFGRNLPGAQLCGNDELFWFTSPASGHHGILHCYLPDDNAATVNAKLDSVVDYFKARHLPIGFSVGPTACPAHLTDYLVARGFTYQWKKIGMALNIAEMHTIPVPTGLMLQEITDTETLRCLRTLEMQSFGCSETVAQAYYDTYAAAGFGVDAPWHHFLAWQSNTPVAIASLLLHAGIAGIYGVTTLPEARQQGIATAITLHTLHAASSLGYKVAALAPSDMAMSLYRRIGFQERCTFDFYYRPAE